MMMSKVYRKLARMPSWMVAASPRWVRLGVKGQAEIDFWADRAASEGTLSHDHYREFYTSYFGLTEEDYRGRKVLDVGCGPRGSLEWASMATERVGLDPLVGQYRALGIDRHAMQYVEAPAEKMPFEAGRFDIVTSFNSLDHVDDLAEALGEVHRVLKTGGRFLLITEVNHAPTPTEPVEVSEQALRAKLERDYVIRSWRTTRIGFDHSVYRSLREGGESPLAPNEEGLVSAELIKR